ncbi:Arc family DNA-binding protein [Rhizobium sp. BK313]|uniref:Arc family DNA-binding protein n=1 Tax=Rhizobium sp. BK313 TaxID=2587081 RepID=UPI0039180A88
MSKDDPQFNLRMPLTLRRKVTAAAKDNNRSVTAEINSRLESTFLQDAERSEVGRVRAIIENATSLLKMLENSRRS